MTRDVESRVRKTGLWLHELIQGETPSFFKKEYWTGKVMDRCMKDEAFKVEMFRFVDVFPYLTRPESVARHLVQYFCRPEQDFPAALQWGLRRVSPKSKAAQTVAKGIASNIKNMGKQFIAGSAPQEALSVWENLRSQGMAFTADLLGEAVVSEKEAERYLKRYFALLETLDDVQKTWEPLDAEAGELDWGCVPKINVSIKPSAMYSQMHARAFDHSVDRAKERLRLILRKAVAARAHVCLDMEHNDLKNLTLAIYRSLLEEDEFKDYPHTGIVIQAYLRDSEQDLKHLLQWARKKKRKFTIRLVKGAYWDAEVVWAQLRNWPIPVFTNKHETDANFEKLAGYVLENHQWVRCACASHNIRSIAYVMEMAKEHKVPQEQVEYQILYGMAEPVRNALRKAGLCLRLYTPVGEMIPGMAYLVRRLLENTSNESFLRQRFSEAIPQEQLLRNPLELLNEETFSSDLEDTISEHDERSRFQNEPLWDWTLSEYRERFSKALREAKKKFPHKVPLFVGGKRITTGREIKSTNPNDPEEVVGIVASGGKKEVEKAIAIAGESFSKWRDIDPIDRAEYLFEAAARARKMRFELAALQVHEVGKNWREADAGVCEAIDFLEYYGREMIRLAKPRRMGNISGETSHLFYEPRGVAVVIAPWNFPFAISMGMTSAALVAGNTVVYKPSSQSSVISSMMYYIFQQTKLPRGVLNFLPGPGDEIGDLLVAHPDVALIAFTGSKDVGLRIIKMAGNTLTGATQVKKVVAEMGGKNGIIVDSDADLDEAILHVIQSAFGYQGQKCSACSRLIVVEENYDKLIRRLKDAVESIELGSTEDPKHFMGAVIDAEARQRILEYIEIGKEEGKCLVERDLPNAQGHFVPLTIFTDIGPEHRIAQEEIFGPVLAVIKVKDFDEALEVANNTPYALTGGVFSRSPENINRARREFRVGNLYINRGCTGALTGRHPFGGFKLSGVGSKAGGPDYLLQFMVPRTVAENTLRRGFAPMEDQAEGDAEERK
jgi:RHH-type proline utilization regulon transcriptional repressor/proline dehydrogenase/delta 1-pyrroline-5-carboxylate dehydrogenase